MAGEPKTRPWTRDEIEREEAAQRERVRRDALAQPGLAYAVAHTEFAQRFADAFQQHRRR